MIIPIQKSKLTRRRAADSTDSTARRDNEVRLFFWIGIRRPVGLLGFQPNLPAYAAKSAVCAPRSKADVDTISFAK